MELVRRLLFTGRTPEGSQQNLSDYRLMLLFMMALCGISGGGLFAWILQAPFGSIANHMITFASVLVSSCWDVPIIGAIECLGDFLTQLLILKGILPVCRGTYPSRHSYLWTEWTVSRSCYR